MHHGGYEVTGKFKFDPAKWIFDVIFKYVYVIARRTIFCGGDPAGATQSVRRRRPLYGTAGCHSGGGGLKKYLQVCQPADFSLIVQVYV